MQRRAVAVYVVFFLLLGASSFTVIAVAEKPGIELQGQAYGPGDSFAVGDQEYTVSELSASESGGGGHGGGGATTYSGELTYVNESFRHSAELPNNSTVPAVDIQWDGQTGRHTATLADGQTISYQGAQYEVAIRNASNLTLVGGDETASFAVGDTLRYRGNATTVDRITESEAVLAWGYDYRVLIPNETAPTSFTFEEQLNVSDVLRLDSAVYNETVTVEGERRVVYRSDNSTEPLSSYLPEPERREFSEGQTLVYNGTEVPVTNVTTEAVLLEWVGPKTLTVSLSEGANVTLGDQQYVAHFRGADSVVLSTEVAAYQQEVSEQEFFVHRIEGLWWVTMLSAFAAVLLGGLAYLPVRG